MTDQNIVAAVEKWFEDNYSGAATHGTPEDFDEKKDNLTDWVLISVTALGNRRRRKTKPKVVDVSVSLRCAVRAQTNIYGSSRLASQMATLFEHKFIDVLDHDTSGDLVGGLQLHEARITDETLLGSVWQEHLVVIPGVAQSY